MPWRPENRDFSLTIGLLLLYALAAVVLFVLGTNEWWHA